MKSDRSDVPALSVVVPVYNAEAHLTRTLDSILGQTFEGFECLVMDDGSADASADIAEAYAARDPRVTFFRRKNRGVPDTANEMIGMARGRYVTRADADDINLPDRFARQIAYLDAHQDVVAVGGQALYMDEEERPIFVPRLPLDHEEIDANNLRGRVAFVQSSVMMRAEGVRQAGGYDPAYPFAQDLDLWLRLAEIGRLANLPDTVLHYRFTTSGISGSRVAEQSRLAERACRAAWARRGLPPQDLPEGHWRPTADHASRHDFFLKWGWQAWQGGHPGTALHFFRRAIGQRPLSAAAWKALAVVALGRRPKSGKAERQMARGG